MSDLTDFLCARLDEHEAAVLRDVEAKRAIIAEHEPVPDPNYGQICRVCWSVGRTSGPLTGDPWPCRTVRVQLAVYSDHPDYQQKWKP